MKLIAHRGEKNEYIKENTLKAFNRAFNNTKFAGVELDIRMSKDKKIFVYHDSLFKGKLVSQYKYKELKKYDIPLLKEVLKIKTNKIIMIEVKDTSIPANKLIKEIENHKNIYIMSFNNKYIINLSEKNPKCKLGILNYIFNSMNDYKFLNFICLLDFSITDKIVDYFKTNNIEIFSYGVTNSTKYKDFLNYIID